VKMLIEVRHLPIFQREIRSKSPRRQAIKSLQFKCKFSAAAQLFSLSFCSCVYRRCNSVRLKTFRLIKFRKKRRTEFKVKHFMLSYRRHAIGRMTHEMLSLCQLPSSFHLFSLFHFFVGWNRDKSRFPKNERNMKCRGEGQCGLKIF
jgi:hypothetical protein